MIAKATMTPTDIKGDSSDTLKPDRYANMKPSSYRQMTHPIMIK